nr:hypothetical protein [Tanacetum cinerariifolium]
EVIVPEVDDVSLVDGVFDGAFGGDGEEDVVIGEGVVVASSSLERLTKSCLGGIMISLIFLEGLEEEASVKAMEVHELNNDVKNDLEDFKRCIRSMGTVHWKLFARDDGKTTGVLPKKKSKTINQEPQSKTDLKKSIKKFLDGQKVTNMFFKTNVNDMITKMKQNKNNFQTIFKNMKRKINECPKSQNVSSKQTNWTEPPPPLQAHTEHVNSIFTGSGKSNDPLKTQKDPPLSILVINKTEKDKPIETSKKGYHLVKTNEYPFREYLPMISYPKCLRVDHSYLNRIIKES